MTSKIKIGVFGAGRGEAYAAAANFCDAEVVAVCDRITSKAENLKAHHAPDAVVYADFDDFLDHPGLEAVVLCNYFNEHAPFAIKALNAAKHVISECVSNFTIAEGVELCRAVEASGKIYKLAENYPYSASNMEMRRIYREGTLGRALYAEGEYIHPMSSTEINRLSPGETHWRNWIPPIYYITHSMAPLMYITDAMPKEVNARAVSAPELKKDTAVVSSEAGGITLCTMDNDAVYRVAGWALFAGHGNWYRIAGTKGAVESVRGNQGDVWLRYNSWSKPTGAKESAIYTAQWHSNSELAEKAGHGGGDFWVMYNFIDSIKTGKQPYFDVYRGVAVSSIAIMAWRSVLSDGAAVKIPDFKSEAERKLYENDRFTPNPFATSADEYKVKSKLIEDFRPSKEDYDAAYSDWAEFGFDINTNPSLKPY